MALRSAIRAIAIIVIPDLCLSQTTGGLSLKVQTQSGAPVAGATVRVEQGTTFSVQAATDSDGKERVTGLTHGEYKITVIAQNFEQSTQSFVVEDERRGIEIDFTLLSKLQRQDNIDVIADIRSVEIQEASPPEAELHGEEVSNLPTRPANVAETLPLCPGVNRDP